MRLLVVEDEAKLSQYLHKGLSENGYVVDVAHDGIEGRRLATGGDCLVDAEVRREDLLAVAGHQGGSGEHDGAGGGGGHGSEAWCGRAGGGKQDQERRQASHGKCRRERRK